MRNYIDITGQKFGMLIAVKKVECKNVRVHWECQCDCGNTVIVAANNLKNGHTKSCGCYKQQRGVDANIRHGQTGTRLYKIWTDMKYRCTNPQDNRYQNYGGRGIKVCDEWSNDFKTFYDWAMVNGYSKELTIDRIKVNGNYEPSNCKWSTYKEQANNTTKNHFVTINGVTKTISQWSDFSGVRSHTILKRIQAGWPVYDLLLPPWNKKHK